MGATRVGMPMLNCACKNLLHVQDRKPAGTDGGGFVAGEWRTRDLNTLAHNDIGASIATKQITMPKGTYLVNGWCVAFKCDLHQAQLYDVTAGGIILRGMSAMADAAVGITSYSPIAGVLTLGVESLIEIQHQCTTTRLDDGLGKAVGFGDEIYTNLIFWKLD